MVHEFSYDCFEIDRKMYKNSSKLRCNRKDDTNQLRDTHVG